MHLRFLLLFLPVTTRQVLTFLQIIDLIGSIYLGFDVIIIFLVTKGSSMNIHRLFALCLLALSSSIQIEPNNHVQTEDFLDIKIKEIKSTFSSPTEKISTLFWVYMAADNDLQLFADRNLEQMKQIGSNKHLLIVVHLDIKRPGGKKITQRFIVFKNKLVPLGSYEAMDSGNEKTLIDAAQLALKELPEKYGLDFEQVIFVAWNHGMGPLNPIIRMFNPSRLFRYNPETRMIELDRSIGFIDFINGVAFQDYEQDFRGVCYDQSTGNYLTEQKFRRGIEAMKQYRNGQKLDIICFDACLMGGAEVVVNLFEFAHYAVFSQEAVPGTGWDYSRVLAPLAQGPLEPEVFARHIVAAYEKTYSKITNDYTQSAVVLEKAPLLNENIDKVAKLLINGLHNMHHKQTLHLAIKASRDRKTCTHFDEPSYIDLHHFYHNLLTNLDKTEYANSSIITELRESLQEGIGLIKELVIANVTGRNLRNAMGLSIYFPERPPIHSSYRDIYFSMHNSWLKFLIAYHGSKTPTTESTVHGW